MSGLTTTGAVAGAVEQIAADAQPGVNQLVEQSYEVSFKDRIAKAQGVIGALIAKPNDAAAIGAFDSLLAELCDAAGYVRTGGVQCNVSISVSDLAIFADVLAAKILGDEKAAAALAK